MSSRYVKSSDADVCVKIERGFVVHVGWMIQDPEFREKLSAYIPADMQYLFEEHRIYTTTHEYFAEHSSRWSDSGASQDQMKDWFVRRIGTDTVARVSGVIISRSSSKKKGDVINYISLTMTIDGQRHCVTLINNTGMTANQCKRDAWTAKPTVEFNPKIKLGVVAYAYLN